MQLTLNTTVDLQDEDDVPVAITVEVTPGIPASGLTGDPDRYDPGVEDTIEVLTIQRIDNATLVTFPQLRVGSTPRFQEDVTERALKVLA